MRYPLIRAEQFPVIRRCNVKNGSVMLYYFSYHFPPVKKSCPRIRYSARL